MSWTIEHHPRVASTQAIAVARLAEGVGGRLAVVADRQDAGRGRQGRSWLSEEGGLYLSCVLRPGTAARDAGCWSLLAGLAVADAMADWSGGHIECWLKWPNDIFVGDRKIAGVLCEAGVAGDRIDSLIVGLGLNVRRPLGGWPAELVGRAVAADELWPGPPLTQLLDEVLQALDLWCETYTRDGPEAVLRAAHRAMLPLFGRTVRVEAADGTVRAAAAAGLDVDGALLVVYADGTRARVVAGDVHLHPGS